MDTGQQTPRPRRRRRRLLLAGGLAIALTAGGGAAWAADRFLIEHVSISDVSSYEAANSNTDDAVTETTNATITDTTYESDQADITLSRSRRAPVTTPSPITSRM